MSCFISDFFCSCQTNGIDHVNYNQFVNLLDWKDHPLPKQKEKKVRSTFPMLRIQCWTIILLQQAAGAFGDTFNGFSEWSKTLKIIDYPALLSDLQS